MKIFYKLIVIALFITSGNVFAQGGNNCAGALANAVTLPFSATGQTNCGAGNTYTSGNSTACGSTLYLGGQDYLYAFTPTTSGF
ncbi:MAG: hypothetical protein H6587_12530 [Flavobacteriales bacterium]|nr:hypothetical protein [Flavobacteriales bacterium]